MADPKEAGPPHWEELSDGAREAMTEIIRLLAVNRFTGRLELVCSEGGVREWDEVRRRRPRS